METKEEIIKNTISQLMYIARKYADIEQLPIVIDKHRKITTREAHTIKEIGEHSDTNITSLANRLGVSKSAASQMTAKLLKNGYIEKILSPHSNKEYLLRLTALGQLAFNAHETFHGKDMDGLVNRLNGFSLSQIATIGVLLEAVGNIMDERLSDSSK